MNKFSYQRFSLILFLVINLLGGILIPNIAKAHTEQSHTIVSCIKLENINMPRCMFGATQDEYHSIFKGTTSNAAWYISPADFRASIGYGSWAGAKKAFAAGAKSIASGENAVAIGAGSQAMAYNSIAIGTGNTVTANNTTVVGNNITADTENSVILGNESSGSEIATIETFGNIRNVLYYGDFTGKPMTDGHYVSIGSKGSERQIKNVAAGKVSNDSTDAINGSQLYVTNKILENVGESVKNVIGGVLQLHLKA